MSLSAAQLLYGPVLVLMCPHLKFQLRNFKLSLTSSLSYLTFLFKDSRQMKVVFNVNSPSMSGPSWFSLPAWSVKILNYIFSSIT